MLSFFFILFFVVVVVDVPSSLISLLLTCRIARKRQDTHKHTHTHTLVPHHFLFFFSLFSFFFPHCRNHRC